MPTDRSFQESSRLIARTVPGLHTRVVELIVERYPRTARILDLGCGTGALASLLTRFGFTDITAVDRSRDGYAAEARFFAANLDAPFADTLLDWAARPVLYDLITAIEVIEHLENPSHFLRECRKILAQPSGRLLITSPNVECVPGRLKFLRSGNLRHFDEHGDPTHLTPLLSSLLDRLAERNGYEVEAQFPAPSRRRFHGSRAATDLLARCIAPLLRGSLWGDCNIFVLRVR
jgi:SAM-dependent methyltransferase